MMFNCYLSPLKKCNVIRKTDLVPDTQVMQLVQLFHECRTRLEGAEGVGYAPGGLVGLYPCTENI